MPDAAHHLADRNLADRTSGLRALSKITPPVHARITPNARLHARLDVLRERAIVWIHGLPGAGKTSLVAGFLGARGIAPLWYRLDDGDSDPASLFVFLGRAAAASDPEIAAHLPSLSPQQALPAFARAFFQALFSHAAEPFLVFDDYHEIDPASATHALLVAGLAEAPPGITVVVVSRAGPPPDFSRLRANGQLAVIGPEELQLTPEEARAVVRDRDAGVPAASIESMIARAHGWTAGLVLILEAQQAGGGSVPCPTSTVPEAVFDYFAGEIFRRMEAATQDHLLSLAQLPAMTAATATQLTGSADAARTLDRLVRRSYFTTRDAQERPSYRFHPLFHAFLRATARETWPAARLDAIRLRAARLLDESGQPEAAIHLLAESGAWPDLVGTVLRWAPVLEREGRVQTLSGWLDRLPPGTVAAHGWLSYWAGAARMGVRPSESRPHFERARDLFEQASDQSGLMLAWAARSQSIRLDPFADMSELDALIAEMAAILARDPSFPSPEAEMRVAIGMYSSLERRMPDHPDREAWRDRALALARAHPEYGRLEMIGFGIVIYEVMAGRFASARRMFDELPDPSSIGHNPFAQQIAYFAQGYLQAEGHLPGEPSATCQAALDAALRSGTLYWLHFILAMAALQAQNRGDLAASEDWIATIRRLVSPELLRRSAHHHVLLTQHDLLAGRLESARRHAETGVETAVASGWFFHEAWARLTLAELLQHTGELAESERQIDAAAAITARGGQLSIEFYRLLLVANLHFVRGRNGEGLAALDEAYRHGRRTGVRRLYRIRVTATPLCARALAAGIEIGYVRDLVRWNALTPPDPDIEAWPWPLKIATFGGLAVLKDEAPLAFGRKTPRRLIELIKAIVAFGGTDVPEAQIVDALWPEEEGDAARQAFTIAVHRLRKLLGDPRFVLVAGGRVGLNPELCWLDLWSFDRLLDGKGSDEPAARRQERALALYRGDFLAGDDGLPWTAPRREQTRRRYVRACADLAGTRSSEMGPDAALDIYRRGIEAVPTAEALYRGLMACHRDRGERAEGMAVFRRLESALAEETGRRPAPESVALQRALAGH